MVEDGQIIERGIRQEDLVITAQSLFDDNHSPKADKNRVDFDEKSGKRKLVAVVGCSDARTWTSGDISLRNIAGAIAPTGELVSDPTIQTWNSDSHFDSDTFSIGVMPIGCGGLGAKNEVGDTKIEDPGVKRYASERIEHPDPIVQAIITGENIAALNGGRPVLATAQDHLTAHIYPIAFFQYRDGEEIGISAIPRRFTNPRRYDPEAIYANADHPPSLNEDHLPEEVQELLDRNRREARENLAKYPDLRHLNKVQKPRMVLWTTDRRFARNKFPSILIPGSTFKIHSLRAKGESGLEMDKREIDTGLDQLSYPIGHAVDNHEDPTLPFSNTDTVIIETGDLQLSRRLAEKALEKEYMQQFLIIPGRKIILLQTNDGIVNDFDEFSLQN